MDIHKPKPWHGVREFAKEIGTIVIGVLIALGAEQAVEWLHRQHEVAEAREALRQEMARNATAMRLNVEEAPCLLARLDRIAAWADGGPPPIWDAGRLMGLNSSAWDEAKTSAVPHMPLKERIAYDDFYAAVANRSEVSRNERTAFAVLARYMAEPQVAQEERRRVRQDVTSAKVQVGVLLANDRAMLDMAKAMGVTPRPFRAETVAGLTRLCDGATTALNRYLAAPSKPATAQ